MENYMKKIVSLAFVACVMATGLHASPVDIMVGARGYGFGGAYAGIANDPSAAYWNPAGLSQVKSMSLMESNWIFQDVLGFNVNYLNFSMPIGKIATFSGSWLLQYAALDQYESGSGDDITLSTNASFEHMLSLSAGRALWSELGPFIETSLGFSVNRFMYVTDAGKQSGLGVDLGFFTKFPYGISLGVVGRSLLSDINGEALDPEARLGVGYSITLEEMHKITADVDAAYKMNRGYGDTITMDPGRQNMKYFGGLEYALLYEGWEFAVRGGANGVLHNTLQNWGFAAGIGITYQGYSVQYAFKGDTKPEAGLGYSHRADIILELARLSQ